MPRFVAIVLSQGRQPRAHQSDRQALLQEEEIGGAEAEHHQRVPVEAIAKPAPARQRQIFVDRQGIDIADAAPVEIARGGVVDGMGAPPEIVRRQRQHADDAPDPVIGAPVPKESAVTAIMLDHEQTNKKTRGRNGQQQIKPVADVEREPHQQPKENERHDRDQNFDDAAPMVRFAIARKSLCQGAHVGHSQRRRRVSSTVVQNSLTAGVC